MDATTLSIEAQIHASCWDDSKSFLENMKTVMRHAITQACWAISDDDQFKAAVGAIYLKSKGEDRAWLEEEMDGIKKFNAALNAGAAGLGCGDLLLQCASEAEQRQYKRDYAIMKLFRDAKKEASR